MKVTVLGTEIEVRVEELQDLHGHFDADKLLIRMDTKRKQQSETFLHEVMHAALFVSGLTEIMGEEREEAVVRCLEHALFPLYGKPWKRVVEDDD